MSERRALRLLLSGRVQGVGFRHFTRKQAEELGLTGTVANLPDGRVEVEVAGDPEPLADFQRRLRRGPRFADVREVEESEIEAVPEWEGFRVVHR
jgi:acylphosphatase